MIAKLAAHLRSFDELFGGRSIAMKPQFSLRSLLLAVVAFAYVSFVAKCGGVTGLATLAVVIAISLTAVGAFVGMNSNS